MGTTSPRPAPAADYAKHLGRELSNLEKKGLIRRRANVVFLTKKGRQALVERGLV